MTTFHISQFRGYSKADILEYLQLEDPEEIMIILDKPADFKKLGADQMAFDYYQAAYLGQELARVCEDFALTYPEMKLTGKFTFQALYPRLPELSTLLHFYTEGFDEEGAPDDDYLHTVMNFVLEMDDKETIACMEFLDIAMIAINGEDPELNPNRYRDLDPGPWYEQNDC
jgi:hypothetical protein